MSVIHDKLWVDMPEFKQEKQEEYAKIIFRFDTEQDLLDFSKLIGQNLTKFTKSARFPELIRGIHSNKRYVDES